MNLSRYRISDAYTLEELRRDYQCRDAKGRIELIRTLKESDDNHIIPYEIAVLAVEVQSVEVRQWIARYGEYLDYSEIRREYDKKTSARPSRVNELPERNLEIRLEKDPDHFVRACLRENSSVFSRLLASDQMTYFQEATRLERLALMRNPEVWLGHELIRRIFDHDNHELGVSLEERKELIAAFLPNKEAIARLRDFEDWPRNEILPTLWELASKWPKSPEAEVRRKTRRS